MMVYYVPDGFQPNVAPHGNSKSAKPFNPTLPSTLDAICKSEPSGAKQIVSNVPAKVGGVLCASDPCSLPRNEQQVYDVKRRQKKATQGTSAGVDELGAVMQRAYLQDHENVFIREMKILREPAIILALDRQLNDLANFCTDDTNFGIMTIDPTFSLGEFDVTVTMYQQLVLQCRRTSNHPIFIGPVMVHYKKSFSTYVFFASTLLGLKPELSSLKCFGTDGEEALYEAFGHVFPRAIHLFCSLHMKRNVKAKLKELGVGENVQQVVIGDIFGKQVMSEQVEGLIDSANDEEFEKGVTALCSKWERMDSHDHGPLHAFGRWFCQYKKNLLKKKMLKETRINAGLGNPPSYFATNSSESMNAMLKNKVDYKKSELPEFLE